MKIFKNLAAMVQALPDLATGDWVDLPAHAVTLLNAQGQISPADVLEQPTLRLVVRDRDEAPRMGYTPWLPVAVLRQMNWPTPSDITAWFQLLQAEFGRGLHFAQPQDMWAEEDVPDPHWPPAHVSADQRLAYWHQGLQAHAWMNEEVVQANPCSLAELRLCEWRLGCSLPQSLRGYYLQLGVLDWSERLLNPRFDPSAPDTDMDAIGPVHVVFPGISDIVEISQPQQAPALMAALDALVAFGDYLGNGNLWCFDRRDGSVWYLDHDSGPLLTRVFDDAGDYLDALALMALCLAHATADGKDDGDARAEAMLRQRLGSALVKKWMY
ncbi:SMI1/KNR4 family protein [Comamonas sp. GB3 AK4-5]|uniref:SMI1/KNR4 family protein n=1 Tax=Comamonas sp. GB3 AK4-5 TaxID=3231487 RepID=UPI00351DB6CC